MQVPPRLLFRASAIEDFVASFCILLPYFNDLTISIQSLSVFLYMIVLALLLVLIDCSQFHFHLPFISSCSYSHHMPIAAIRSAIGFRLSAFHLFSTPTPTT